MTIAMQELKEVIAEVLDLDEAALHDEILLEELPEWDSVNAVRLMLHLESELGVRLEVDQVMKARTLNDLIIAASGESA